MGKNIFYISWTIILLLLLRINAYINPVNVTLPHISAALEKPIEIVSAMGSILTEFKN